MQLAVGSANDRGRGRGNLSSVLLYLCAPKRHGKKRKKKERGMFQVIPRVLPSSAGLDNFQSSDRVTAENVRTSYSYVSALLMCRGSVPRKVSIQFHSMITTLQDVRFNARRCPRARFAIENYEMNCERLTFVHLIFVFKSCTIFAFVTTVSYVPSAKTPANWIDNKQTRVKERCTSENAHVTSHLHSLKRMSWMNRYLYSAVELDPTETTAGTTH